VIEPVVVYLSLVLARVGLFIAVLPMLGGAQTPRLVKLGLAVALTALWGFPSLERAGTLPVSTEVPWLTWGLALGREAILGAVLGFAFSLFLLPARIAGEYLGQEIGLSFANLVTPAGDGSAGPLGVLLETFAALLFLGMDVHHVFLSALDSTFRQYPVGQGFDLPVCDVAGAAMAAEEWGLVLAAPAGACLFLVTIVLALLARAAPQLNLYTVGFSLRLGAGLVALLLFLPQMLAGLMRMIAHFTDTLARIV
jgi:flagellar biosynthetic protein FliR